jgi:hypothetical protein
MSHPVLRPKLNAHCICAQDQDFTHMARITAFQIKPDKTSIINQSTLISIIKVYCLITAKTLNTALTWKGSTPQAVER